MEEGWRQQIEVTGEMRKRKKIRRQQNAGERRRDGERRQARVVDGKLKAREGKMTIEGRREKASW